MNGDRGPRAEDGFGLVEMIVSMAVLGVFFAVFSTVVSSSVIHGSQIQNQAVLQTEARAAIDTLVADLRQATVAGDTNPRISTATGTALTFLSPNRSQPMRLRRISYQVTGGKLQRAFATSPNTASPWAIPAVGAWATVIGGVVTSGTPVFTYFDGNGAATAVAANVRTIRIRVPVATAQSPANEIVYDTRVTLRPAS